MTVTDPANEHDETSRNPQAFEPPASESHAANERFEPSDSDEEPVIATIDETSPITYQAVERQAPVIVVDPNTVEPKPKVVYVTVPHPPRKKGNRIVGSLIALAATLVFAVLLAGAFAVIWASFNGSNAFGLTPSFYIPVALFAVGLVIVVLLANRAGWWAYILGSLLVAAIVYFGSAAGLILIANVVRETPDVAAQWFTAALLNPLVIIAGLLAREVSMWTGLLIGRRGRKVKARNVEARAQYDREQAEREAAQRSE